MTTSISVDLPSDYPQRVKNARELRGLTQERFAELVGVSFATVNRWENRKSKPNNLAWSRVLELEANLVGDASGGASKPHSPALPPAPNLDFAADAEVVSAVAEAHRLAYGHLFNSAFATEISLIDPLPHQRIAVYEHMVPQAPLRFLLADDAGAGKTIMTGLYVREMLSRRLIRRVLIVPPAGLVGNWEHEMRGLFGLKFHIVAGQDAKHANPFSGPDSNRVIVSLDTLTTERMFGRLQDPATRPYDLVVFDEAHKLSANRRPDLRVDKTDRYRLAEAIAGADVDGENRATPWSAQHLLLLTATPHMGKDHPYYFLWRLLLPDTLPTYDAFVGYPRESRRRHFIRRTKEEMVNFDGSPLYPQRNCNTLSYELTQGPGSEQDLYEETTHYIRSYYNRAQFLNRSAARLAMAVFQRRLASSTYALMRSFERRKTKLEGFIDDIRNGRLSEEQLRLHQGKLNDLKDVFETRTSDELAAGDDGGEQQEEFEGRALDAIVMVSLVGLEDELPKVEDLLGKARDLLNSGEESKFEQLRGVLTDSKYANEKFIIFTEHRDTADFLQRRLEGLGFTGQVAMIHGGMPYQEREQQVEFFRRPPDDGGARFLIATDAAGEGINLQFCWLMVNYDIPWNPARLEQRMGRIHRYGQTHDPVVIINLVAGGTREGRVMKTLLDKLEAIRRELQSDKVFDVIGRLFEGTSLTEYLEQAVTAGDEADAALQALEGTLTPEQVRAIADREQGLYGEGGDVGRELARLAGEADQENYRRLLPGYVRRFVQKAAPLLDMRIEGDLETTFTLVPARPGALDALLGAFETYPEEARGRLSVYKPGDRQTTTWLHPGEPVFDRIAASIIDRFGHEARRGGVFVDPYATEPYLFHIALVSVEREPNPDEVSAADPGRLPVGDVGAQPVARDPQTLESQLVGLRQTQAHVEECPVEHLLLLRGGSDVAPGRFPFAALGRRLLTEADEYIHGLADRLVRSHRQSSLDDLPERLRSVTRGFDHQAAELAAVRARLTEKVRSGDPHAKSELPRIKERQRNLAAAKAHRVAELRSAPDHVRAGETRFLIHALVVPTDDAAETERFDAGVENIAIQVATAYEESMGAKVTDVSRPALARRAGLGDWPGFDLQSLRPGPERRAIEVKGRATSGNVEMSQNEYARACNLGRDYWLYVIFDCATPNPRLVRVQDPFTELIAKSRDTSAFAITPRQLHEAAEPPEKGAP